MFYNFLFSRNSLTLHHYFTRIVSFYKYTRQGFKHSKYITFIPCQCIYLSTPFVENVRVSPIMINRFSFSRSKSIIVMPYQFILHRRPLVFDFPVYSFMIICFPFSCPTDTQDDKKETSPTDSHLSSLRSKITFTPTQRDNRLDYSCQAVHPALAHSSTSLTARVTLDVHCKLVLGITWR